MAQIFLKATSTLAILSSIVITGCKTQCGAKCDSQSDAMKSEGTISLVSPRQNEVVSTLFPGQKAYLAMPRDQRVKAFANEKYRGKMKSLGYYPQPTTLVWSNSLPAQDAVYTVTVTSDFNGKSEAMLSVPATNSTMSVTVDNLEIARTYTWVVSDGKSKASGEFKTEDIAPRLVRIPGVPNVRDLGGRIGLDGRRVKQSIVYRTAGLNDNASESFYTKEELIAKDPSLKAREDALVPELTKWKGIEAKPESLKIVKAPLSTEWTLFFPDEAKLAADGLKTLKGLDAVPAEFLGATASKIAAKDGETMMLDKAYMQALKVNEKAKRRPAVLMQVVEAEADGFMAMSAGGDYYWYLCANGEKAFDLETAGNWRFPYNADSYAMPIPVKKGKNLIAAIVKTGTGGWSWGCKSAPASATPLKLAHDKVRSIQKTQEAVFPRTSKGKVAGKNRLSPEMKVYMTQTLGVKSDIDLRSDGECWGMKGSPMGDSVTWFHYSSGSYAGMQKEFGREAFKNVFKVFLDEKNYPIVFHCIAGQDRTGAVAFIINGLLGVEEEELYLDWESTGFWNGNAHFNHERLFNNLVAGFQKWPGKTINEKIEAYVLDLGFTKADIEKLRSIMLE